MGQPVEALRLEETPGVHLEAMGLIISALESSPFIHKNEGVPGQQMFEGNTEDGTLFRVRLPHLRKAHVSHAIVGIVDLNFPDGAVSSFVIKRSEYEARFYQKFVGNHPSLKRYLPGQYGLVGNWAVLERLYGLEERELSSRLKEDPDFLELYATNAYNLIEELADNKVSPQGVFFAKGHNVMVDPTNAEIRLVEQTSLGDLPDSYPRMKALTCILMEQAKIGRPIEDFEVDFVISLFKKAFLKYDPKSLFVRSNLGKPYRFPTEIFSDDFVKAVLEEDTLLVRDIVASRKVTKEVPDKDDPREP